MPDTHERSSMSQIGRYVVLAQNEAGAWEVIGTREAESQADAILAVQDALPMRALGGDDRPGPEEDDVRAAYSWTTFVAIPQRSWKPKRITARVKTIFDVAEEDGTIVLTTEKARAGADDE
jgi:hypothetical protein